MGWTYTDLQRSGQSLEQAKLEHVARASYYSSNIRAGIVIHEWRPSTWFALVALNYLPGHAKAGSTEHFLRVDMIEASPASFGYKDMEEGMGPYVADRPSAQFAKAVFKYLPEAEGYAAEFRDRMGIPYIHKAQLDLFGPGGAR